VVPTNALQRTFHLQYQGATATCFTIDVQSRQYIVTAKHCLTGEGESQSAPGPELVIDLQHAEAWKALPCRLVGLGEGEVDIAVLAAGQQLSPTYELSPSHAELFLGQDVYFLGFPFGEQAHAGALNNNFPLPLVKKACVSMFHLHLGRGPRYILLDGQNNIGFSGGPVLFARGGHGVVSNVAAVVSAYRAYTSPVYENDGKTKTSLVVEDNSGLVEAYSIDYAVELINANPIGFQLPSGVELTR
jgi:S1-C subfamily serine protease